MKDAPHVIDVRNYGLMGAVELEPDAGAPGAFLRFWPDEGHGGGQGIDLDRRLVADRYGDDVVLVDVHQRLHSGEVRDDHDHVFLELRAEGDFADLLVQLAHGAGRNPRTPQRFGNILDTAH